MRIVSVVLVILAGMVLATNASANSILNGSFEGGSATFSTGYQTLSPTSTTQLDNWVIEGGEIDWISNAYWQAGEGDKSLDLTGTVKGITSQSFATDIGALYEVKFLLAGNPDGGGTLRDLRVTVLPSLPSPPGVTTLDFSFDITGKSRTNMGWTEKSFQFTAADTSSALKFESLTDTNNAGPALDFVRVERLLDAQGTTVPVPAAAWLGLAMMGGLGLIRRHRRRSL